MFKEFLKEDKAQISAELIIILAAVVALVLLFVTNIKSFSESGINKAGEKFNDVFDKIDNIG